MCMTPPKRRIPGYEAATTAWAAAALMSGSLAAAGLGAGTAGADDDCGPGAMVTPLACGAVVMRVRRCPPVRVDALPHAVQCDTRHMTTGHARQKGGSS